MKKVAIIVVTFNRCALLQECIDSLRKQSYEDRDIIIVNNGSTDGTNEWLNSQSDLIVINQANCGGAGGFYTGLKYSAENGYAYSWLMDDDVEARVDTLQKMMDKVNTINGFLCSRVIDINGDQCNVPRISDERSVSTGEPTWGDKLDCNMLQTSVTSFVSVLIPNKVVAEIGLPYKEYFIWGDDSEYTRRISKKYASYMVLDSIMLHKRKINGVLSIFTETNATRVKFYYYSYRNRIHYTPEVYKKFGFFALGILDSLKLVLKGSLSKAGVPIKGSFSGLFFRPTIKYPD